jgi:hypothetical protein
MLGPHSASGEIVEQLAVSAAPRDVPVCSDAALLVFLGQDVLASVPPGLEELCWQQAASSRWCSSRPFVLDELVFAAEPAGRVVAFASLDGSERWSQRVGPEDIRSISGAGSLLYLGTQQGMLYACRINRRP